MLKVGDEVELLHRKTPEQPFLKETGKIISFGITKDGINYAQTDVGSFTKKYALSHLK